MRVWCAHLARRIDTRRRVWARSLWRLPGIHYRVLRAESGRAALDPAATTERRGGALLLQEAIKLHPNAKRTLLGRLRTPIRHRATADTTGAVNKVAIQPADGLIAAERLLFVSDNTGRPS
jgi:hypothetical protein